MKLVLVAMGIVVMLVIAISYIFGFLYVEHMGAGQYTSDYWTVGIKNSRRAPIRYFECSHADKYYLVHCYSGEVLENSTNLQGALDKNKSALR